MQYKQAYLDARRDFAQKDPQLMAELAGGQYLAAGTIEMMVWGQVCRVTYPEGRVSIAAWPSLPHEELILILQYLAGASGLPLRGRWLSFLELPGGPHHFAPFQQEAIFPLARVFGSTADAFLKAAKDLGGVEVQMGHAGVVIPAFPKIPLAFMLWTADEEFPATANILFDASSPTYLRTASLYMLGIAAASRLMAGN